MVARTPHAEASRGTLLNRVQSAEARRWGTDPADFDPEAVRGLRRLLRPVFGRRGYLRVTVDGWSSVPDAPTLVASNHSGGTWAMDAWGWNYAWTEHFRDARPLHTLAHEMVFGVAASGRRLAKVGLLRAERGRALSVLQDWGRDVYVMPGGDRDIWRPFSERYKVCFAGRKGYARLAIKAGVPITPVAHVGAHHTLMVLTDGKRLARALRLPQLARAEVFPVHLSLPWGVGIGPVLHLPPPVPFRYRIGAPIPPPVAVAPGEEPPAEAVEAMDEAVRQSIQSMLDALRAESPWRRRLNRAA